MSLHWLPVQYRIQYKLLMYNFKALHSQAPIYLAELVSFYQPSRLQRSENAMMIKQKHMMIDVLIRQLPRFGITCIVKPRPHTPWKFLR